MHLTLERLALINEKNYHFLILTACNRYSELLITFLNKTSNKIKFWYKKNFRIF